MRPLRVLQVGYFERKRLQRRWFNTEHKLAQGLARAGHFVLRFSDRDEARGATLIASQKIGAKRMNERLVETARHFRPQLILFHHADLIAADTYDALREASPGTRLTQVCVDSVERPATMAAFSARADHVDISFMTTADSEALRRLAPREGSIAFPPNPVDPSVETARVFDIPASARQSALYDDGVVEFASRTECAAAMADLWHDDGKRRRIGETGWRIAHSRTNSTRVARTFAKPSSERPFPSPMNGPSNGDSSQDRTVPDRRAAARQPRATGERVAYRPAPNLRRARQMEEKKPIVGHGGRGALVAREEGRFDNEFPPDGNGLRYVRHNKSDPP